ncbi:hypothetical protein KDN24_13030 [Bacillus sp. Bva_UNVM-123]|uniref:hypothetical protein n=1 Tax=Bacillus sp. Bva_UNVM-123 TaxID=2829798 RepID=UPI00391EF394
MENSQGSGKVFPVRSDVVISRQTGIKTVDRFPKMKIEPVNGNRSSQPIPENEDRASKQESKQSTDSRKSRWRQQTGIKAVNRFPKIKMEPANGNQSSRPFPENEDRAIKRESKQSTDSRKSRWSQQTGIKAVDRFLKIKMEPANGNQSSRPIPENQEEVSKRESK